MKNGLVVDLRTPNILGQAKWITTNVIKYKPSFKGIYPGME